MGKRYLVFKSLPNEKCFAHTTPAVHRHKLCAIAIVSLQKLLLLLLTTYYSWIHSDTQLIMLQIYK